jgi:hypothetical protein
VILGIVPPDHLSEAGRLGQNAVGPLKQLVQRPLIFDIGN